VAEMIEGTLRVAARAGYEAARDAEAKSIGAAQPFFAQVGPLREEALTTIAAVLGGLRQRGCPTPADMLHAQAVHSLAFGDERGEIAAFGPEYWSKFGLP